MTEPYLVYDYETVPEPPWDKDKDNALVYDRMAVVVMSVCVRGHAYSCPTSWLNPKYPDAEQWAELWRSTLEDSAIRKVMHNVNYDDNVTFTAMGIRKVPNVWCTLIGSWIAAEYQRNSLKERALHLGRLLRKTSTVDFNNGQELGDYAEGDVLATEELYLLQSKGEFVRTPFVRLVDPAKPSRRVQVSNDMPAGVFKNKEQTLTPFKLRWFHELEMPVLQATIRAERYGFGFRRRVLRIARLKLQQERAKLRRSILRYAGWDVKQGSAKDMEKAFAKLKIKTTVRTKTGKLKLDARTIAKLRDQHPFVAAIITLRQMDKLGSVYIGTQTAKEGPDCGLEYYVNPETKRIHCTMNTVGAVTGRESSSNPNLQQIPNRKDVFNIRRCFGPTDPDRALLALDYSQLELRIMALLSRDPGMIKVLSDRKGDMHTTTAERMKVDRTAAKQLNFLLQYGGKSYALAEQLNFLGIAMSEAEVDGYRDIYNELYARVPAYRQELLMDHQRQNFVRLFLGRTRHLPDIDWGNRNSTHKAETTLSNNVVQGSGQDMLKGAIVRADWHLPNPDKRMLTHYDSIMPKRHRLILKDTSAVLDKYRKVFKQAKAQFILQVHDEAIVECDRSAAEEVVALWARIMAWPHYFPAIGPYTVPLVAEGGVGSDWKACKGDDADFHVKIGFDEWEKYAS